MIRLLTAIIIAAIAVAIVVYLTATFVEMSFNPADWHVITRVSCVLSFFTLGYFADKKLGE